MSRWSDVDLAGGFGLDHLPYSSLTDGRRTFVAVRVGDHAVNLTALTAHDPQQLFDKGTLDRLLAAGRASWAAARAMLQHRLSEPADVEAWLVPLADVTERLPFTVGDYVDFYASEHHATNVGRIFRPNGEPLTPNWKHLPIGYHGRAGTFVVSGTEIARPAGQRRTADGDVVFGPSIRLDLEAEVGFVLGGRSEMGLPIPLADAGNHLFGVALVNDWSARDVQAWEYVPLGPFLGKSFATSMSAWITPLAALGHAWTAPPARDVPLLPYLDDGGNDAVAGGLDIAIDIAVNGSVISKAPFATMYWTPAQMLAHLTVNGASIGPGDVFASGTVSGPGKFEQGSLLELTRNGMRPVELAGGRELRYLEDGDEVVLTASAPSATGRLTLGQCRGRIRTAAPTTAALTTA